MSPKKLYYAIRPIIPRSLQLLIRRKVVERKRRKCGQEWPIDARAAKKPENWNGWPAGKQFALVLTHDVETEKGHRRCYQLAGLEKELGFRSCFNFVPRRYMVSPALRRYLTVNGFEVGVHGLYHDGKLLSSRRTFLKRAELINLYLKQWKATGFRAPAMHHNLAWIRDLDIQYDASTFDTDPFEPQPDGAGTIFPFFPKIEGGGLAHYLELPYTLPQDFTLFVLLKEPDISIWKQKLDWLVRHGGMVLLNTHPDYMSFDAGQCKIDEYPVRFYLELLSYIRKEYAGRYFHALPRQIANLYNAGKSCSDKHSQMVHLGTAA